MTPMPERDIDWTDTSALAKELKESSKRMDKLKSDWLREQQWSERVKKGLDALIRDPSIDDTTARRIESRILKSASVTITKGYKTQTRANLRKDALFNAEEIGKKHGYRSLPPRIEAEIDKMLDKVYGKSGTGR